MRILLSAYACEPDRGSEPGVGWNTARSLARRHEVWVITRANNRPAIERELAQRPVPNLHLIYFDLPRSVRWWKRGQRGVRTYYYLWQLGAAGRARRVHRQVRFDLAQHVTFVKYWAPSLLAFLPLPFVWGPVGGGESTPRALRAEGGIRARVYEWSRSALRALGERDPWVRLTARRCAVALATTSETEHRLRRLRVKDVRRWSEAGLTDAELTSLRPPDSRRNGAPIRFVSAGRLLHWKGFHLSLWAFAEADVPGAGYWIFGDGPQIDRLRALARELGIDTHVTFWGGRPRAETLQRMKECDVLVHPSLHDSGGWVCLEAMAGGLPVLCLDTGGPATQVTSETGIRVHPGTRRDVIRDLAAAMTKLAQDDDHRIAMGRAARRHVDRRYRWTVKAEELDALYQEVIRNHARKTDA